VHDTPRPLGNTQRHFLYRDLKMNVFLARVDPTYGLPCIGSCEGISDEDEQMSCLFDGGLKHRYVLLSASVALAVSR
jgi:hypothetical protein